MRLKERVRKSNRAKPSFDDVSLTFAIVTVAYTMFICLQPLVQ